MLLRVGIVIAIAALGFAAYKIGTRAQVSRVARKARDANGAPNGLMSELTPGVPGIIYFWSPDCAPCFTVQKPALTSLMSEWGNGELQVIEINVYERPDLANEWGVLSLPTTFLVDADGTPRGVNHGVAREDKLRRQLSEFAGPRVNVSIS